MGASIYDIFKPTGSFYATTNDLQVTGSLKITSGSATFVGSNITANNSNVYLTSGSGLYIKDDGYIKTSSNADYFILKAPNNNYILNTPILTNDDEIGINTDIINLQNK